MHLGQSLIAFLVLCAALTVGADPVSFNRDILPILSNNCFACHGPDAPARKAGLRLDQEDTAKQALPSGAIPIASGVPDASAILHRITSQDPDERMPPPDSGKSVTEEEQARLVQWISEGAPWQPHWAFIAPVKAPLPATTDSTWPRNGIDHFVLARLEAEGIAPSPEADRYTLIRRVAMDLTGLLPSPKETEAFVSDSDPMAYEALVERLLASPRHGEHRARQWLDLARYADTNGYAADIERTMWRYRDWVIEAFNQNMPFDQFTIEQLAGDLLPNPTLEQRIATGFNRNHPIMMEGGAIFEEYRVQNVVDRVDTTATTWLGLTMKCAQCHDHKYDPLSQKEYFSFYAYFNNVSEAESVLFGTELDGNSLPRIKAPNPAQQAEAARLEAALTRVREEMLQPIEAIDAAQQAWEVEARARIETRWPALETTIMSAQTAGESGPNVLSLVGDTLLRDITALRLRVLPAATDDEDPLSIRDVEIYFAPSAGGAEEARVAIGESMAGADTITYLHDGNTDTAWTAGSSTDALLAAAAPFGFAEGTRVRVVLRGEGIAAAGDRVRLALSSDPTYLKATLGPWHINGPYIAADGDSTLTGEHVDPAKLDLSERYPDGRAKWTTVPGGLADGTVHNLSGKTCATYFYRSISAPAPRSMDLLLNNRNAVRCWVNGRLVLDKEAQRGEVGAHPAPLSIGLREGANDILVMTADYYDFNAHTFYFARVSETVGPMPLDVERLLMDDPAAHTEASRGTLRAFYRSRFWDAWAPLHTQELDLTWALAQLDKQVPTTMVMDERTPARETQVLIRGLYDQPGEVVAPGVPAAVDSATHAAPQDRLGLARWLVDPENPLTARVAVNRDWQRFFGAGLVRTSDDFGVQGEWPSHPELLDWLARTFIESGWDMKAMQRLIVTSATYRQASRTRTELTDHDPENRLLARGPRYRLDAEQIRDNALAASGLLVEALGGSSVKPYQPPGLWRDVAYGGGGLRYTAQEFIQDHGEKLYRRSLYTFWKRAAAPPGMLVFDAPNRDICTARRSRSNTPLQALALMNDTQYVEAARAMAERIMTESGPDAEARADYAALLLFARPARPAEKTALLAQYHAQLADYQRDTDAARELLASGESDYDAALDVAEFASWTLVANALMNADAAVTQY